MIRSLKDPVSGLTHAAGALLSVVGLALLLSLAAGHGTAWHVVAFAIFGASLILLYTASSVYHLTRMSPEATLVMRKVDHMMIFVLIAGTYTPFCLLPLRGPWGWTLLAGIWTIAVAGIVMKLFWMSAPRWLSTALYLLMGWLVVVAAYPMVQHVPAPGLLWLLTGGLFYSVGAVIYGVKRPNPLPGVFGFHEIWHLFVMAGSLSHFLAIYTLN